MSEKDIQLVKLFQKRIKSFEDTYKEEHDKWRTLFFLYRGDEDLAPGRGDTEALYNVKLIFSVVRNFIPSLVISDPDILLFPRKMESMKDVATVQRVANYYWRELKIKDELKKVILDVLIYGTGFMKLGWAFSVGMLPVARENKEEDLGNQKTFQPNEFIKKDAPFVTRVSPFLLRWDMQARSLAESRWVAEKIVRPVEVIKRNSAYDQSVTNKIQPTHVGLQDVLFNSCDEDEANLVENDPDKYAVIYEVHDKERGLLITLHPTQEKPLRIQKYPYPNLEGTHFCSLVLDEQPDRLEGLSVVDNIKSPAQAVTRVRSLQTDHIKNMSRVYAVKSEDFSEADVLKVQNAKNGSAVRTEGDPRSYHLIPTPPISPDSYRVADQGETDVFRTAGLAPSTVGQKLGGRTSATEAGQIGAGEAQRMENARTVVEDFAADITRKLIQIIGNKLSDEEVVLIVGEENFTPFKYTKKQLQGEFSYAVKAGSMTKPNREVLRQQLLNLLNISQQDPIINRKELWRLVLETYDAPDIEKILTPPPAQPPGGGQVADETLLQQEAPPSQEDLVANNASASRLGRGE